LSRKKGAVWQTNKTTNGGVLVKSGQLTNYASVIVFKDKYAKLTYILGNIYFVLLWLSSIFAENFISLPLAK
jgi:hypothetical protein